jgi:3-methyladenine DNA glycosylase AlkD
VRAVSTRALSAKGATRFFTERFRVEGAPDRAAGMKAYMKSDLSFFGVDQATLRSACRDFAKLHANESLDDLFVALDSLATAPWFELRSAAIGVVERRRKELAPEHLDTLLEWVKTTACWAHVDWIATKLVGAVIASHPAERKRLVRWARDPHLWVRRTALLAQLDELRAGGGDFALFAEIAVPMLEEKEFFIRKAIGWVLRDTSRKRPELVRAFLAEHGERMSGLTRREASKYV